MKIESISNQLLNIEPLDNVNINHDVSDSFTNKLNKIDESIMSVMKGGDIELHELLIEIERAKLTLEYTITIRDKVIDAYKEITKMQI